MQITIILPVRNTVAYLDERIDSIIHQTNTNWNCLVLDGFSSDGSWERLQQRVGKDTRFSLKQAPPKGIYNAWNQCIREASGDYIYIATSDDSMTHNCLNVMQSRLAEYPQCGMAHCCLQVVDADNQPLERKWSERPFTKYFGSWMERPHIRLVPHDAMLHCFAATVYLSMTQLMIRKTVFDHVGLFREDIGSMADYEWGLRASLLYPVIHIPQFLAMWRVHAQQATNACALASANAYLNYNRMIRSAVKQTKKHDSLDKRFPLQLLMQPSLTRYMNLQFQKEKQVMQKFAFLARVIMSQPSQFVFCMKHLFAARPPQKSARGAVDLQFMKQKWIQELLVSLN